MLNGNIALQDFGTQLVASVLVGMSSACVCMAKQINIQETQFMPAGSV
jgi:hypothetical protein